MVVYNNILAGASGATGAAAAAVATKSLRFNSADTANLYKSFSSSTSSTKSTISFWVKRGKLGSRNTCFSGYGSISGNYRFCHIEFAANDTVVCGNNVNNTFATTQVFRDPSAWYHFVLAFDTTQATASDRVRFYVNGSEVTDFSSTSYPSQNGDALIFGDTHNFIGANQSGGSATIPGDFYLADIYFVDGLGLSPTSFGAFDDNGVWQAAEYSGTYGTNGFHLDFSDATSTTTIAEDSSGNDNDWTANNISVTAGSGNDSMFDAPTNGSQSDTGAGGEVSGNYCTMSPLALSDSSSNASVSLSNGNLEVRNARTNYWGTALSTFSLSSGKWYFEAHCVGGISWSVGIYGVDPIDSRFYTDDEAIGYSASGYEYKHNGDKQNNLSTSSYGATYSDGDVIGVALDLDGGTLTFYKNGTSQGTAFSSLSGRFALAVSCSGANSGWNLNFGQRAFTYQNAGTNRPADTFKAVCTTNLPPPDIADGSTVMDVALYTGTGNSGQTVSGLNFSPDLVWFKSRSEAQNHAVFDTVRGVEKRLQPSKTQIEDDSPTGLTAFNSDGFTFGSNNVNGKNGVTYVSWAWDAGTSTVSNTDGSITSQVRANPSAGFSIVTWTRSGGSNTATIGHGLNAVPELIILKDRDSSSDWYVGTPHLGGSPWFRYLVLNSTAAYGQNSDVFQQGGQPSSSVFGVGAVGNPSGNNLAYCFAPVAGYSAFGSYTGNGSSDGPFVYTGMRPAFVLIRRTNSAQNWAIHDTARDPFNEMNKNLAPNLSSQENNSGDIGTSSVNEMDCLSNGFKLRDAAAVQNASGGTYIYAAFAEHPFKTTRAR